MTVQLDLGHYQQMVEIRLVEEAILSGFDESLVRGTAHTCIGQEAIAVASMAYLQEGDNVLTNHRGHGHYLAAGGDAEMLILEILGDRDGISGGLGGSQHLHFGHFYSNGILGGIAPVAAGMAKADKLSASGSVTVCFLGDGALGEGVVYESMNIASLWSLPILFVIENNRIAQTTPIDHHLAGSIAARPRAFGIETSEIESNDVAELLDAFGAAFKYVRNRGRPFCQIVHTFRLAPHSKGDDPRSEAELRPWRDRDPLVLGQRHFPTSDIRRVRSEVVERTRAMVRSIEQRQIEKESGDEPLIAATDSDLIPFDFTPLDGWIVDSAPRRIVDHLREALETSIERRHDIYILGEDIVDPGGGAFKVTEGLSTTHPHRIFTTPISEAAIVGIANGMALRDLRPVVEIMFGDFTTLAVDQVVNHATKFGRMYGEGVTCPVIIRSPMGGYRGYGPTHSQSLEKLYLGIAGLVVVALSALHDQHLVWERMLGLNSPVFYVENKTLYGQRVKPIESGRVGRFAIKSSRSYFPTLTLNIDDFEQGSDAAIITYGGMVDIALDAAELLFIEDELSVDVVVVSQIAPLPENDIEEVLARTNRIVTLEEGTRRAGWGAEVSATLLELAGDMPIRFARCAAVDTIIPNSPSGEEFVLPAVSNLLEAVRRTAG